MEPADLTVQILREIRDEIHKTNEQLDGVRNELSVRIDRTNERLDGTNERLEELRSELSRRIVDSEVRTATAITALAGAIGDVKQLLADRLDVQDRVARCEQDIALLKERVGT
jgi:chromosome segregation ATPase